MEIDWKKISRFGLNLILLIVILVGWQNSISGTLLAKNKIAVWIFDVGQGDAIFIDAPDKQILIDGGPTGEVVEKLTAILPFWDRELDVVINTHPHADHVTGLIPVLARYQVNEIWVGGQDYDSSVFQYFKEQSKAMTVGAGAYLDLGAGAKLEIVWPKSNLNNQILDDPNDGSIVAVLEYGETRVLLTGDIGTAEELQILNVGDIDVLKVGHQGSLTSSGMEFLKTMKPEVAIISVGDNDYGHPSPIVLDRFELIGSTIFRTDIDGDVRILIEEVGYQLKTFQD